MKNDPGSITGSRNHDPDQSQKLTSSSLTYGLPFHGVQIYQLLFRYPAHRQTDRQTDKQTDSDDQASLAEVKKENLHEVTASSKPQWGAYSAHPEHLSGRRAPCPSKNLIPALSVTCLALLLSISVCSYSKSPRSATGIIRRVIHIRRFYANITKGRLHVRAINQMVKVVQRALNHC